MKKTLILCLLAIVLSGCQELNISSLKEVEGKLMNGFHASTSKYDVNVLVSATVDGNLCTLSGTAKGNLSDNRANIKLSSVSCKTNQGKFFNANDIDVSVIGKDGILGVAGELIKPELKPELIEYVQKNYDSTELTELLAPVLKVSADEVVKIIPKNSINLKAVR